MSAKQINALHWLGSAFAALLTMSTFSLAPVFFLKTEAPFLGVLLWQIFLGFMYGVPIFLCSVPLIRFTWKFIEQRTLDRWVIIAIVCACMAVLIASLSLPYLLPLPVSIPIEGWIVMTFISGMGLNIAVFAWLSTPPNKSLNSDPAGRLARR